MRVKHTIHCPAENDFILAAKLDGINKEGLLRGKKKYFKDV